MRYGFRHALKKSNLLASIPIVVAIGTPCVVRAQIAPGTQTATVQVINPMSIKPLIGPAPWNAGGPATHRMVVSHDNQGAIYLDIGYNDYRKGIVLAVPYAYKTDELCLVPSGHIRLHDEDDTVEVLSGMLMWRPAGGVTRSAEFLQDTVTICAMSPARLDATSYRIPKEAVEAPSGKQVRPVPKFFVVADAPKFETQTVSSAQGVVEREVLSMRRDGSSRVSVAYLTMQTGSQFSTVVGNEEGNEQICYVMSGALSLDLKQGRVAAPAKSFIYRPAGARIVNAKATTKSALVCFDSLPKY